MYKETDALINHEVFILWNVKTKASENPSTHQSRSPSMPVRRLSGSPLRAVRWLWVRKIDFLYFLCVERHWYTSVQNKLIFWKFFFMASLDAETHFTRAELFSSKIEGWISANCRAALSLACGADAISRNVPPAGKLRCGKLRLHPIILGITGTWEDPHEKTPNARERPYYIWYRWPYMYIQYVIWTV